jgi:hypothetical protein
MMRPTVVLPVKLTFLTAGCSISVVVIWAASAGRWYRTLRTPGGRPAAVKMDPMAQKQRGESSELLRMTVLPAARA